MSNLSKAMKILSSLGESAKKEGDKEFSQTVDTLLQYIPKANHIVISESIVDINHILVKESLNNSRMADEGIWWNFDAPFNLCWVEPMGESLSFVFKDKCCGHEYQAKLLGVLCENPSEKKLLDSFLVFVYEHSAFQHPHHSSKSGGVLVDSIESLTQKVKDTEASDALAGLLSAMTIGKVFDNINQCKMALDENAGIPYKAILPISKKRIRGVSNRVIYITDKKQKSFKTNRGTVLPCTYRFEVRGHWRVVPGGIGKDSEGRYGVPGKTWVVPHERGQGELIKKTRIIQ